MRYLVWIFVLFCVGGLVRLIALSDSTPEEERPHHLVRLTGVVSLHGTRIEIDELFACWGHHPETGYEPGREILVTRDQRRFVMAGENAVLTISPSTRWCGAQDWVWNDDKEPRPNASEGLRWTPYMSWSAYDPDTDTAQGEIMISATAWNDPAAPCNTLASSI